MIAILVAVKQEIYPILQRADARHVVRQQHLDFYEGNLAGQPVALLALGVGKDCARIAAEITIRCYRPDLIISAGFGGGLQPDLQTGDIVIGTQALDLFEDHGADIRWRCGHLFPRHDELNITTGHFRIHFGKILSTDEMILKAATKRRLGKATGALTVDMETSAVAAVAAARQTDMLAVRCISDLDRENLPLEFNDFFVIGQLKRGRIVTYCARRPKLIADLARIGYRAHKAGKNLARFLEAAVPLVRLPAVEARRHA